MPYGFVQRACAPARSIHVGAWAGVAVPRVDGHGAVSGAAYEALHTGRLLGAVERACLGVPSRAAHTAPQRQRTASSACSPQAILWRPPHTLARGVRHCQPGAIPPRSAPPDNPLLRAGCWREREQHLAAGLRHCACAPLPPTSLVCVTRPLTARQCAAAAAHAHQIVSPLTARSCPSKPELLPARPCRPRFDALANADASQAAAASSTAGAASRSQQESTAFVLGPLGKTFLPRHEEPALTLWQGPCSCCFLSVGGLDLSDALWLGLRTVTN